MNSIKKIIINIFLVSVFSSSIAFAQEPEDIIKYRINIMKAIGSHISVIAANVKGKVDIEKDIETHSEALYITIKSINIEKNFPENSLDNGSLKTRSLKEIFTQKKDFATAMQNSISAAKVLLEASKTGDKQSIGKALGGLGKTCGACHKKFRKEK